MSGCVGFFWSFCLFASFPSSTRDDELFTKQNYVFDASSRAHEKRQSQTDSVNALPLYPTEDILWDTNVVPVSHYDGQRCLALPKLNLQFLTIRDYLLRYLLTHFDLIYSFVKSPNVCLLAGAGVVYRLAGVAYRCWC